MRSSNDVQRIPKFRPLAVAAAVALLTGAAQAQFYSYSGSLSAVPDVNVAAFDITGSVLGVGDTAEGSFSALAGALMTADGLNLGSKLGGGSALVIGGSVNLNGTGGRVIVGNSGNGLLAVSAGGVVEASLNPTACLGNWCGNNLAWGAGSTGTLTIDGNGSEVRLLRNFIVGDAYVDSNIGTAGGTATIGITSGGKLLSGPTTVGRGSNGPNANGSEKAIATVDISGTGSQWMVTRNTLDIANAAALLGIGGSASATAAVTVSAGGKLRIDGTGSSGPKDGINIGSNGKGTLIVTGAGSALEVTGVNTFINVGANNAAGDGSFQLLAGATASALYLNVGRNGGKAVMSIDGVDSKLTQSGVGTAVGTNTGGAAFATIGRNGGNGEVTVKNGGQLLIGDGGVTSAVGSPGLTLGRDAGGIGKLTISGTGSKVGRSSRPRLRATSTPS